MAPKLILTISLIITVRFVVCQTISIEFVETPVIYPVGGYLAGILEQVKNRIFLNLTNLKFL
jgi:hypothetical protein